MDVFISYSATDMHIVKMLGDHVRNFVDKIYYWDKDHQPGQNAWESIYRWIDASDIVIAIITDKTVSRAMSVGNEIGYAKKACKIIVPLVSPGIKDAELGCLKGITYIRIDKHDMSPAINTIKRYISSLKDKQQENLRNAILIIGGIIFLYFIAKNE